jgi:hypothetical protein
MSSAAITDGRPDAMVADRAEDASGCGWIVNTQAMAVASGSYPKPACLTFSNALRRIGRTLREENDRLRALLQSRGIDPDAQLEYTQDDEQSTDPALDSLSPSSPAWGLHQGPETGGQMVYYGTTSFHPIFANVSRSPRGPGSSSSAHRPVGFSHLNAETHNELLALYFTYLNGATVYINPQDFSRYLADHTPTPHISHGMHLALLGYASFLSRRLELRGDPEDNSTAGIAFTRDATDMALAEMGRPTPATVYTFLILCATSCNGTQDSWHWVYAGIAVRLAVHLGLHIDIPFAVDRSEREIGFWRLFTEDKCTDPGRAAYAAEAPGW